MSTNPESLPTNRIAKVIARAGVCSRRDAERLILEGRVKVNGSVINSPALNVLDSDSISVNGKLLEDKERTRLWMFYKPNGYVVSRKDEKGRDTIYKLLPPEMQNAIYIGRLDLTSEGLLLLTNNGELSRHLELPSTGWIRKYRARIFGNLSEQAIEKLKKGITVEGVKYAPIIVEKETATRSNSWLQVSLTEGKNREIRNVFEHFGHRVSRLIRISYGPFQLSSMKAGEIKEVQKRVLASSVNKFE